MSLISLEWFAIFAVTGVRDNPPNSQRVKKLKYRLKDNTLIFTHTGLNQRAMIQPIQQVAVVFALDSAGWKWNSMKGVHIGTISGLSFLVQNTTIYDTPRFMYLLMIVYHHITVDYWLIDTYTS